MLICHSPNPTFVIAEILINPLNQCAVVITRNGKSVFLKGARLAEKGFRYWKLAIQKTEFISFPPLSHLASSSLYKYTPSCSRLS